MNRSHPEGEQLLLCISTVRTALAGATKLRPPSERRRKADKGSGRIGKNTGTPAGSVKNFRGPAMLKTIPLDCEIKGSLREKRRDPWLWANASSKTVAVPWQVVKTRKKFRRRVLTWFAGRWRNHQPKRAEKPHSKSAQRKLPDGPATRPITPLAVENGVGKPAAPEKGAPNAGLGKREWRTPTPHLSLSDRKVGQGLMFFAIRGRG